MASNKLSFFDMVDHETIPDQNPCAPQQQQVWLRVSLGIVFYLYIALHGAFFEEYGWATGGIVAAYIAINLAAALWHIPHYPRSNMRLLTMPAIDCLLISLMMFNDGGHASPAFFLFLSVIFGNGLRYGLKMLIYTQILSVLSLVILAILTPLILHQPNDWIVLVLEILGVLYISTYAKMIIHKTSAALEEKRYAEMASSQLLIDIPTPAFTFEKTDGDIRIVQANPAMAKVSPFPVGELPGRSCRDLCIHEDAEILHRTCLDTMRHAEAGGVQPVRTYVRSTTQGKPTIQLMCDITITRLDGKNLGICFITDITESDRYHQELQEAQMQGYVAALASGLAHDFRNVLASIMGEAEVLQMSCPDEKIREGLEMIIHASERGSDMTTHLLQMGRGSARNQHKIDLTDGLEATVKLARVRLPASIRLSCRVSDSLPCILGDLAQIEQVLLNLINNAAQAIPDSGQITVEAFPDLQHPLAGAGHPALCIRVSDDGVGIPEEHLQRIFDPFWTTRKEAGGTGLGLSMVRRIMRWHKGDIDVSSTPGKGTRFTLCFPPATSQSQVTAPGHAASVAADEDNHPPVKHEPWHILLVEDAPDVMRVHQALLSRMGHKVSTAINGQEALALLQRTEWDVDFILTDYRMPEMDGLVMIQHVREQGKTFPITIITAYGEDEALQQASNLDTQLLFKPVKFSILSSHISDLQKKRLST